MGYRIEYGREPSRGFGMWPLTAVFFLTFLLWVHFFWPEGAAVLRRWVVPEALEALAESLKNGESIGDVVEAFSQGLVHGQ